MDLSVVPYTPSPSPHQLTSAGATYRECLRNHAAAMGGQAVDGCGEFMPKGNNGLHCAACGCHRNFHRQTNAYLDVADTPIPYRAVAPTTDRTRLGSETPPRSPPPTAEIGGRKRFRTKFTPEQKEKMAVFAGKIGWRIQRHDVVALQDFCSEIGVTRHVLKVWMHNNKHHHNAGAGEKCGEVAGVPSI